MIRHGICLAMFFFTTAGLFADDYLVDYPWTIDIRSNISQPLTWNSGETVALRPSIVRSGQAIALTNSVDLEFTYWTEDMDDTHYSIHGTVYNALRGQVQFVFGPTNEAGAANYFYNVRISNASGAAYRGEGTMTIRSLHGGVRDSSPLEVSDVDCVGISFLNPEYAPWISALESQAGDDEARAYADAISNGLASAIASNVVNQTETNAAQDEAIAAAAAGANMGGDVSGQSTNATVAAIQGIPVDDTAPTVFEDGYGLKYDHATGQLILGPVATEGNGISNLLVLTETAAATDVTGAEVGVYRAMRPGYLPTAVINVGGYEVGYFDLLGITLKAGSIHLLGDELAVNVSAYDGAATAPAYTFAADESLGSYRISYQGGSAEAYTVASNRVWFWAADGIHLDEGAGIFGLPYADQISTVSGRVTTAEAWATPQASTNDTPTVYTPRYLGDELIIHDTTQRIYRAFGTTTNDWASQ